MGLYNRLAIPYRNLVAMDRQGSAGRQADDDNGPTFRRPGKIPTGKSMGRRQVSDKRIAACRDLQGSLPPRVFGVEKGWIVS